MNEPFVVTAIPQLLPEGDHKGHLEHVQFVATDGFRTEKWSATNTGTLAEDFAKILSPNEAAAVLDRLRQGETVIFPGFWALHEIKHKFGGVGNE